MCTSRLQTKVLAARIYVSLWIVKCQFIKPNYISSKIFICPSKLLDKTCQIIKMLVYWVSDFIIPLSLYIDTSDTVLKYETDSCHHYLIWLSFNLELDCDWFSPLFQQTPAWMLVCLWWWPTWRKSKRMTLSLTLSLAQVNFKFKSTGFLCWYIWSRSSIFMPIHVRSELPSKIQ